MKKILLFSAIFASVVFTSCDLNSDSQAVKNKAALETQKGKHSYAIGADIGRSINMQMGAVKQQMDAVELDLDYSLILQGIKDKLDTTKPALMNDSEATAALGELIAEMQKAYAKKDSIARVQDSIARAQVAAENLIKQKTFLEKNKAEAGVIATESGLQYTTVTEGKGKTAKIGDTVSVHYTGTLLDGSEFDSSVKRNQPLSIALSEGGFIKGWIEMLSLMKKGQKVKVWIPSSLAYGEQGNPVIPGNSLLIFEMELLDIKPAK